MIYRQRATDSQAISQIAEWPAWLENEANRLVFYETFGISDVIRAYFRVEPIFARVYGQCSEFNKNA